MGVNLSKELLASCARLRGRYAAYLAEKQQVRLTSAESRKLKDIAVEIDDKRRQMKENVDELFKCVAS